MNRALAVTTAAETGNAAVVHTDASPGRKQDQEDRRKEENADDHEKLLRIPSQGIIRKPATNEPKTQPTVLAA